jgi:Uncharacterized protein containing caspase domain
MYEKVMDKKSLIIGINNYKHFPPLESCINDATDIHSFLVANGFDSKLVIDLSQKELIEQIKEFRDSISDDTVSVIFFAGHGLQDDKHNFLVVADSDVKSTMDIKYNCVHLDDLFITQSKSNIHIIILDACRNNPFSSGGRGFTVGLSKVSPPAGTLIAFSTSPNAASLERPGERNGIFTKNLLKNIQAADLPIELVLKNTRNDVVNDTQERQVPWEESSLYGDHFCFVEEKKNRIENFLSRVIEKEQYFELVEVIPFLNKSNFSDLSVEALEMILVQIRISYAMEEANEGRATIDRGYLDDLLFTSFFPLFDERLFAEDISTETFSVDIFDQITIENGTNYGYNFLSPPDESFQQFFMNIVKFKDENALLALYLTLKDGDRYLKPMIFSLNNGRISLHSYKPIIGAVVEETLTPYFTMRAPFEPEKPDFSTFFFREEVDDKEFDQLFKKKDKETDDSQ